MNKLLKIFLITLLIFSFTYVYSYATEEESSENVVQEEPSTGLSTLTTGSTTNVSPVNSYDEANLELNNILSVILIAVGVVIILLAIAILIKSKKAHPYVRASYILTVPP